MTVTTLRIGRFQYGASVATLRNRRNRDRTTVVSHRFLSIQDLTIVIRQPFRRKSGFENVVWKRVRRFWGVRRGAGGGIGGGRGLATGRGETARGAGDLRALGGRRFGGLGGSPRSPSRITDRYFRADSLYILNPGLRSCLACPGLPTFWAFGPPDALHLHDSNRLSQQYCC